MSANVILLRHDDGPEDDRVATFMNSKGIGTRSVRPFAGDSLPSDRSDVAGCVIFGGLFNAFDTDVHAFLGDQYAFIDRCLKWDVPILGICLGAQQIAHHLGAHVGPPESNVHEFGYYEIRPSPGANDFLTKPLHVAQSHWHGLDLPSGATHLASSDLFPNQAFRFGENVYGIQFHAEVTPSGFARMQTDRPAMVCRVFSRKKSSCGCSNCTTSARLPGSFVSSTRSSRRHKARG